jgi:type II secretory pathway pseudopilin PulG
MRSKPRANPEAAWGAPRAFTLVEVLAALLTMAIVIPVAFQGMSIVGRAAALGEHKVAVMRVAERVLNEQLSVMALGQPVPTSATGTETDGDTAYSWTTQTEPWARDNMTQMTVHVVFTLDGRNFTMDLSTLYDPTAWTPGTASANGPTTP